MRVVKPPQPGLSTIGIPTLAIILLFLLPFYDRGPERHPLAPPDRDRDGIFVIGAMMYLTWAGATAGAPRHEHAHASATVVAEGKQAVAEFDFGRAIVAQSGCEGCHRIGGNGNIGPGPNLTHIAARLPPAGSHAPS